MQFRLPVLFGHKREQAEDFVVFLLLMETSRTVVFGFSCTWDDLRILLRFRFRFTTSGVGPENPYF